MGTAENAALVRRFYDEAINQRKLALADELLAVDFVDHGAPPGFPPGPSGFKQFAEMLVGAFPDLRVTVDDLIAGEDKVAARLTVTGTHRGVLLGTIAATGKRASWGGMDVFRIAAGRIAERWSQRDLLGLFQQLGVISPP